MKKPRSIAQRLRFALVGFTLAASCVLLLFIAFDLDQIFDAHYRQFSGLLYEVADHIMLPVVVLIVPLLIATPWMINRAMLPLHVAAARVSLARGSDRGFRVDLTDLPSEAQPFASAVNELLGRLDSAAERNEAFAADVAHELKNPLAILRLELDRLGELGQPMAADVAAMSRLVDQLLLLARLDAEQAAVLQGDSVDLHQVAQEVALHLGPAAIADGKRLELESHGPTVVLGRWEAIAAALRNLVENAIRATPNGSTVTVVVGKGPQLIVRDEGTGLSHEKLQQLRNRFQRSDHASPNGAGLGLAIVSRIMLAHQGRLEADESSREVRLVFPHMY